jgi:hypothetical protein
MRSSRFAIIGLLSGALVAGVAAQRGGGGARITPGQECPPGTTETRPGSCQAPSTAPPSIVDYRPKSTLVTVEHKVPKAKFPVIDIHSHQGQLTQDSMKRLVETMDPLNLRVLTLADNVSGERLVQIVAAINASPYKDRFRALAGINFSNVGPGLGRQGDSTAARRHQGRRAGRRRSRQAVWIAHHQARRLAIEGRRSRDRSVVG